MSYLCGKTTGMGYSAPFLHIVKKLNIFLFEPLSLPLRELLQ